MKKIVTAVVAAAFILTLGLPAAKAADAPAGPVKVTNYGKGKVVTFEHSKHKDAVKSCEQCHHKAKEGKFKCGDCHKAEKEGNAPSLKDAAHNKDRVCWSCHGKGAAQEKKCGDCHKG